MHRQFILIASILGGLAVALGAFGAHGLERLTADEKVLQGFRTATQYQMYHALALLIIGGLYDKFAARMIRWVVYCFVAGIIFFSGSLYLLTFLKIQQSSAVKFVGPVTPLGGVLFIIGWILLAFAALKKN